MATASEVTENVGRGYQWIAVDRLQPGEFQPREVFNEADLLRLGQTFLDGDIGIIHPLLVRPRAGGRYEIAAGERRWRAAQLVGFDRVPCIVRSLTDLQCLTVGLVENDSRCNLTPIERARTYVRAREEFGFTQEVLAQTVGVSREVVANHERLLQLPAVVQAYLMDGRLSERHGRSLIGLSEQEGLGLAERAVQEGLSASALERIVRQLKRTRAPGKGREWSDPDISRFIERLSEVSGYQVELQSRSPKAEKGFLRVRYESIDDLTELCGRLGRRRK